MSLGSTASLKSQLIEQLGPAQSDVYFSTLRRFITGAISRFEFEDVIKTCLSTPALVQLHNTLIISFFDPRSHKRPITPPRELSKPLPPRKRRRILPYQGPDTPDSDLTLHSTRLKRWTLSMGKHERQRLKELPQPLDAGNWEIPPTLRLKEEISAERGVTLRPERNDPPGSRVAIHLLSVSNSTSFQHILDKINLVSAQHNLANPQRNVATLMQLAVELKLKQLVGRAIALSATSDVVPSIRGPSETRQVGRRNPVVLDTLSFSSLFTLYPSVLPNGSSAASRVQVVGGDLEHTDGDPDADVALLRDREVDDPRWQIVALLGQRSSVKEALRNVK